MIALERIARALLAGCAAIALLASCSETFPAVPQHPRVGVCHDLSTGVELDAPAISRPPVACSSPHTVQAFALGAVVGGYADWAARPAPPVLESLTAQLCPYQAVRSFLGALPRDGIAGLSVHAYFPTAAAWAAGDRGTSCALSVDASAGAPATTRISLANIMSSPASASLRTCYLQAPGPGGTWSASGTAVPCDLPHSSQDLNAWLDQYGGVPSTAQIEAQCAGYASEFLGQPVADQAALRATGVLVRQSNGTLSLHCAIGGDSTDGTTDRALLPHRAG